MNISVVVEATISEAPLKMDTALAAVQSTDCGAVVSFSGVVRNHDGGREVDALTCIAHPSAPEVIGEVAAEIAARHAACGSGQHIVSVRWPSATQP